VLNDKKWKLDAKNYLVTKPDLSQILNII